FDLQGARALYQVLGDLGDHAGQELLAVERHRLASAAPQSVPAEPWFILRMDSSKPAPGIVVSDSNQPFASGPLSIAWEGDYRALHSLAHVNRQICQRLAQRGHDVSVLTGPGDAALPPTPGAANDIIDLVHRPLSRPAEIHVRHQWPPNFQPVHG